MKQILLNSTFKGDLKRTGPLEVNSSKKNEDITHDEVYTETKARLRLNDDLSIILLANKLCNDYCLGTISTGRIIDFSIESYKKGLINDGIHWGDGPGIIKVVKQLKSKIKSKSWSSKQIIPIFMGEL